MYTSFIFNLVKFRAHLNTFFSLSRNGCTKLTISEKYRYRQYQKFVIVGSSNHHIELDLSQFFFGLKFPDWDVPF